MGTDGVEREGETRHVATATTSHAGVPAAARATWDSRLYSGLAIPGVALEVRSQLAATLGEAGVEAEYLFLLAQSFPGAAPYTRERGEVFLRRLEAAALRLQRVASAVEIATQSYLAALETTYREVRAASGDTDVWWPPAISMGLRGEPLELRLRRCGFAYRHVVATHLATHLEAVIEQMELLLHALNTLPPAGVIPVTALYQGLYELAFSLQGYVIPRHVLDPDPHTPGLLSGVQQLRALTASDDTSIESDIAWVKAQYAATRAIHTDSGYLPVMRGDVSVAAGAWGQGRLTALRDWQDTLAALESLHAGSTTQPGQR
ncbi:MAG: hypothetical protein OJF49_003464 [Ktedonobacterales bacterium]|nr:MAG: hypothetical protein OJF49_003464 [Ktedonobacterales bacterium]